MMLLRRNKAAPRWLAKVKVIIPSIICLMASQTAIQPVHAQSGSTANSADVLKAAFLFNFAKFTTWPSMDDLDSSVQFCIQKDALDKDVFTGWGRKKVQQRPVRVTFFEGLDESKLESCSIMYVGKDFNIVSTKTLGRIAEDNNILLVSNKTGFGTEGGHIEMYLADRRLRFKVNLNALKDADLSIGAGVLRLAEIVSTREGS